jgi:sigma-54 interacting transcriptional regulator/FHA domain-containing protein/regulatory Fis family protein
MDDLKRPTMRYEARPARQRISGHEVIQTTDRPTRPSVDAGERRASPGVVVVFAGETPRFAVHGVDGEIELGREELSLGGFEDASISRRHARVGFFAGRWHVEDLGSRNGTWLDGVRVEGRVAAAAPRVLRLGGTLLIFVDRADDLVGSSVDLFADGFVVGPTLRRAWQEIVQVAQTSRTLHIFGETGAGKERAARHFHNASSRRAGPFVAVNCATIPPTLAERLLFGARKGAFSGADANVEGYIQAADRGTLFLDEIGELETAVQAKLLRVLQSGDVLPLGASRGTQVDVAIVSATHRDLGQEVAAGRFRDDLFYRLSRPRVELPPLRGRPEDIPATVVQALRSVTTELVADASLVEAALLRPWPGNVRELQMAIADAGRAAAVRGAREVTAEHLGATTGRPLVAENAPAATAPARETIEAAIRACDGNVTKAARTLRVHRTSLRRWIERFGIRPQELDPDNSRGSVA